MDKIKWLIVSLSCVCVCVYVSFLKYLFFFFLATTPHSLFPRGSWLTLYIPYALIPCFCISFLFEVVFFCFLFLFQNWTRSIIVWFTDRIFYSSQTGAVGKKKVISLLHLTFVFQVGRHMFLPEGGIMSMKDTESIIFKQDPFSNQ